jgi:hypothetical protein
VRVVVSNEFERRVYEAKKGLVKEDMGTRMVSLEVSVGEVSLLVWRSAWSVRRVWILYGYCHGLSTAAD